MEIVGAKMYFCHLVQIICLCVLVPVIPTSGTGWRIDLGVKVDISNCPGDANQVCGLGQAHSFRPCPSRYVCFVCHSS